MVGICMLAHDGTEGYRGRIEDELMWGKHKCITSFESMQQAFIFVIFIDQYLCYLLLITPFFSLSLVPRSRILQASRSSYHFTFARRICFSFFSCFTTAREMFSVLATRSGGVRASHWVKLMSTTRSLL